MVVVAGGGVVVEAVSGVKCNGWGGFNGSDL